MHHHTIALSISDLLVITFLLISYWVCVAEDVEEGGGAECKRSRGLGTGGPDGPVSLNDVRRLQRSNEELRQQLEAHTLATEKLRSDYRASEAVHDAELKEVRASITQKYATQIEDMQVELSARAKELEESAAMISHQQSTIEDLKQHLAVAAKSRLDAEEAIERS
jgi:DNA-binding helix-hairpin-helix protein with protein kinase domain